MDRQDGARRAGGAAPTLAPGRLRIAWDCRGRTGNSPPPTGRTLTTEGGRPNGTPFPKPGAATAGVSHRAWRAPEICEEEGGVTPA
eukprot:432723-Rhodomonas_salina.2